MQFHIVSECLNMTRMLINDTFDDKHCPFQSALMLSMSEIFERRITSHTLLIAFHWFLHDFTLFVIHMPQQRSISLFPAQLATFTFIHFPDSYDELIWDLVILNFILVFLSVFLFCHKQKLKEKTIFFLEINHVFDLSAISANTVFVYYKFVFLCFGVWHMAISFLIFFYNPHFKNMPHIGSFWHFVMCCISVFVYLT